MRVNEGQCILANYRTFEGVERVGLFIVVYHEVKDHFSSNHFIAIKVSSNEYLYGVKLEQERLPFLTKDNWVNCNDLHRFREYEVLKIIGNLNSYYLRQINNQFRAWSYQVEQGLDTMLETMEW